MFSYSLGHICLSISLCVSSLLMLCGIFIADTAVLMVISVWSSSVLNDDEVLNVEACTLHRQLPGE